MEEIDEVAEHLQHLRRRREELLGEVQKLQQRRDALGKKEPQKGSFRSFFKFI